MLPAGTWEQYDAAAVAARKGRVEQYKHKFLANDVDFERGFEVRAVYGPPDEGKV
jgi:hypothetical protein